MFDLCKKLLFRLTELIEVMVSLMTMMVIGMMVIHIANEVVIQATIPTNRHMMDVFLREVLGLVVALEFVKMLIKHTPGTIVEVLLFTIAKLMITSSHSSVELLLGAISVAALFATRKYLFSNFDEMERIIYRGSLLVKQVNWFNHVQLPGEEGQTLAELVEETLEEKDEPVATGAMIYFGQIALRIAKMNDGKISRVEFIQSGRHLE